CQASCGGSPWFPVREVGPGNPILSDSTGEPPPSTFNYAWDIAVLVQKVSFRIKRREMISLMRAVECEIGVHGVQIG
ncbi:hypothetical protein QZM64_30345, partial [Burkholderia cepacia]|uniref:hypothetical protein n=1 Tax=Burkholderia cepacia TaxID=292 RepID=UPI00264BFBD3